MTDKTKRNLIESAGYAGALFLGLLFGQNYLDENHQLSATSILPIGMTEKTGKVQRVIDLVTSNYVDSINVDELHELAIGEIVEQLDPHSDYLSSNEAKVQHETLEGSFEGIGIEYYSLKDTLMTVGLILEGPAEKAGIRVGDKLISINGEKIAGVNITDKEIENKIRGKRGSVIEIGVHREGVDLPLPIKVVRDKIEVSSIDAAYLIAPQTAYIKVRRFGAKTNEDFVKSLERLIKEGAERLILDFRENGGGYFSAATGLASQFFEQRNLLVYTQGAHEMRTDYYSTANGIFDKGELVVLIDEFSASASEIVAGAIQDLDRGVIVGRRSFGKGLVQEQFGFGDGSALNLTIARYYTPIGRSIQKPYKGNSRILISEEQKRIASPEELIGKKYTTQAGRIVYDGGGIMPDIVVPADSNIHGALYREIVRKNLIEAYVYERLAKSLPAYSVENFLTGYHLPDKDYRDFLEFVKNEGVHFNLREARDTKIRIQSDIEALLGRYYFGRDAYFKVRNRADDVVHTALSVLNKDTTATVVYLPEEGR